MRRLRSQSGQSMVEYILLTSVVVSAIVLLMRLLEDRELVFTTITKPIVSFIKYNYKYGDPNALGWDEARGPRNHVQISKPNGPQNFRLFLPAE